MNKKFLILDYIAVFLISIIFLLASFFTTKICVKESLKSDILYYDDKIVEILNDSSKDEPITYIDSSFRNTKDLRISIFDSNANVLLEINPYDYEAYDEDRSEELKKHSNDFYYKYSNTLKYKVLYYVHALDNYYVRIGLPKSMIDRISNSILIASIILAILVDTGYMILKYSKYKKSITALRIKINDLYKFVNGEDIIESEKTGTDLIEESLDKTSSLLKQTILLLKKEEEKVTYILNTIDEGFIVLDNQKSVVLINNYALNILNLDKTRILNKSYLYLALNEKFSQAVENIKQNASTSLDIEINHRIYEFILSYNKEELFNPDINKGITILFIDVTTDRANANMKREFFQNASHELKTPLTTILGYSELLFSNVIKDEKEKENAQTTIIKESKRMKNIIDDMLTLSILENNEVVDEKPLYQEINLKEEILEIENSLSYLVNEKGLKIENSLIDKTIKMNLTDCERLIKNLLLNAVKYNKEEGSIFVTLNENSLSIRDTGIGIKDKDLDKIFERFYRVDKSRSRENGGTGLGLAIVKHISKNYNFKIKVSSIYKEETTFTIYFE